MAYCLESFATFVLQIKEGIEKLALALACPKIALVASSTALLNRGKKLLGGLGGAASLGAANLGVDFTAGKHRQHKAAC
eukprot:1248089-Pyramimonas_sp.AAC.1